MAIDCAAMAVEAVAPLRIRRFRALWVASVFSNIGSFLQSVAAAWLMLELTDSPTWVGLMTASTTLPILFLALAAGALADMLDRTKVMQASQLLMGATAASMAILTWKGWMTPGLLLGLGLLLGVGVAFNLPAWQALVPDLVPRGLVASAVALNSVAFNVARSVGPALGGLIVAASGPDAAFALNAASYLGVIVVVARLSQVMTFPERDPTPVSVAIGLGIRYARYTPPFRRLLAATALFALTSAVVQTLLPNLTRDELGGDALLLGALLGTFGLGALVGALVRPWLVGSLGSRSVPVTVGGVAVAGMGLGVASQPVLAAALLMIAGACWVLTLTTFNSTAQLMTPEWVRGRAMSLYSLAFVGVFPLGSILSGVVAELVGVRGAYLVMSAAGVVLAATIPRFRLPTPADVEAPEFSPESLPEHPDTEGGPVMVLNTWQVPSSRMAEFLELMREIRLVRLRTGAYRWRLYRDSGDPHRLTEVFLCVSWNEHLAMHRRTDDASRDLIRRARSLDRDGRPTSVHLVAVDIEEPEGWELLVTAHEEYHRSDGAVPLEQRREHGDRQAREVR